MTGLLALTAPAAASDEFVIIDRALSRQTARVVEINELMFAYLDEDGGLQTSSLDERVAMVRTELSEMPRSGRAERGRESSSGVVGAIIMTDGQTLPGALAERSLEGDDGAVLGWMHPWLGRVDVPMDSIAAVTFTGAIPARSPGGLDVVELGNGDRIEGFVTSLGDPIRVDVDLDENPHEVTIPLGRTSGVVLVSQPRPSSGRRVWFQDGTVITARRLRVADDGYARIVTEWSAAGSAPHEIPLAEVAGILFDPAAMVPLERLTPARVESSVPRYVVPDPQPLDRHAPVGLGRIAYTGPLVVHYVIPDGCNRFAAEAVIPESARSWGDFELVVRDDDREVHRVRFNAEQSAHTINVPLKGTELTIELTTGANGPIHDRLVLHRPMLALETR